MRPGYFLRLSSTLLHRHLPFASACISISVVVLINITICTRDRPCQHCFSSTNWPTYTQPSAYFNFLCRASCRCPPCHHIIRAICHHFLCPIDFAFAHKIKKCEYLSSFCEWDDTKRRGRIRLYETYTTLNPLPDCYIPGSSLSLGSAAENTTRWYKSGSLPIICWSP